MTIPDNFPVKVLAPGEPATGRATCGTCHRSWDDAIPTSMTPVPAGRCPFEYFHDDDNTIDDTNAVTLGRDGAEMEWVKVTDLQPADLIDLAGDEFADLGHGGANHECPFEFEMVYVSDPTGEHEGPDCFRLDYEGGAQGFPPDHQVPRVKRTAENG